MMGDKNPYFQIKLSPIKLKMNFIYDIRTNPSIIDHRGMGVAVSENMGILIKLYPSV